MKRLWLRLWTWSAKSKFPSPFTQLLRWRRLLTPVTYRGKLPGILRLAALLLREMLRKLRSNIWAHLRPFYSNTMMQAHSGCLNEAACMMMF
ncbi:TPA: hypothetical protein F6V52_10770 [Klebsiella oxytoca]|uniref:Uncharacterized protein n=1 Tax=Klebsiella oxytoca TaxID=571 RepID=A0AAD3UGD1_KLEOX|nr:hypothetical protein [Klebsiella oxytoca]HAU4361831.1 hypothetical protein [Klebsiella oxytoca]HAU4378239.1 hypothetical protein [Klebsiella oxytoca]HAU4382750.1 hypothetical protein [Klebsiella oxytoca]